MIKKQYLISVLLFLAFLGIFFKRIPQTAFAEEVALWVEPESGVAPLLQAIDESHQEIDLVMYLFTDRQIAQALAKASQRGVRVKVLVERSPYEAEAVNQGIIHIWKNTPVQWQWVPMSRVSANATIPISFYHQKSMVIDHQQAWVMTGNFVYSSFNKQPMERNFIVVDQNSKTVKAIENLFDQDWQGSPVTSISDPSLVVSPLNSRLQLEALVNRAHTQIDIYAAELSDYDFIGALAHAARRGVVVRVIYGQALSDKKKNYLAQHGVQLYFSTRFMNHAKAIVVDHQWVYLGSANFTQNSFDQNREVGIILNNQKIAQQVLVQFEKDLV